MSLVIRQCDLSGVLSPGMVFVALWGAGSLLSPLGVYACEGQRRAQTWRGASVDSGGDIPRGSLEDQEGGCAYRNVIFHNREEREDRMTSRLSTNQWQEVGDNEKENVREDPGSVAKGVLSPDLAFPESNLGAGSSHTCFL